MVTFVERRCRWWSERRFWFLTLDSFVLFSSRICWVCLVSLFSSVRNWETSTFKRSNFCNGVSRSSSSRFVMCCFSRCALGRISYLLPPKSKRRLFSWKDHINSTIKQFQHSWCSILSVVFFELLECFLRIDTCGVNGPVSGMRNVHLHHDTEIPISVPQWYYSNNGE
jgi:hypothetical protein